MHQQEIVGVAFLPHLVRDTSGHGNGRNASGTYQGIHLIVTEFVHNLCHHHPRGRAEAECYRTKD